MHGTVSSDHKQLRFAPTMVTIRLVMGILLGAIGVAMGGGGGGGGGGMKFPSRAKITKFGTHDIASHLKGTNYSSLCNKHPSCHK